MTRHIPNWRTAHTLYASEARTSISPGAVSLVLWITDRIIVRRRRRRGWPMGSVIACLPPRQRRFLDRCWRDWMIRCHSDTPPRVFWFGKQIVSRDLYGALSERHQSTALHRIYTEGGGR